MVVDYRTAGSYNIPIQFRRNANNKEWIYGAGKYKAGDFGSVP